MIEGGGETGRLLISINSPHRNSIGNRKKLENVWASKTSFARSAIMSPGSVEVTAIRNTALEARR